MSKCPKCKEDLPPQTKVVCDDCIDSQIAGLETELDRLREECHWVPVGEGLPEANPIRKKYWVITDDGLAVAIWRHYRKGFDWECDNGRVLLWSKITLPPTTCPRCGKVETGEFHTCLEKK